MIFSPSTLCTLLFSMVSILTASAECTGSSAGLEPSQCKYLQDQFLEWNMTKYGCSPDKSWYDKCKNSPQYNRTRGCIPDSDGYVTDPCAPCWLIEPDARVTCVGESVTEIFFGDIDSSDQPGGTILPSIGALTDLIAFDAGSNNLHGTIPDEITTLTKLKYLGLSDNKLTGTIPEAIGNLLNVVLLAFSHNQLTGSIPKSFAQLAGPGALTNVDIQCNMLAGFVPPMDFMNISEQFPRKETYDCFFGPMPHEQCNQKNNFSCPLPDGARYYCLRPPYPAC